MKYFFTLLTIALDNKVMNIFVALFTMHCELLTVLIYIANITTQIYDGNNLVMHNGGNSALPRIYLIPRKTCHFYSFILNIFWNSTYNYELS